MYFRAKNTLIRNRYHISKYLWILLCVQYKYNRQNKKNIILMYFWSKNTLIHDCYHTLKYPESTLLCVQYKYNGQNTIYHHKSLGELIHPLLWKSTQIFRRKNSQQGMDKHETRKERQVHICLMILLTIWSTQADQATWSVGERAFSFSKVFDVLGRLFV
jgi:hypothetical protein